jgi:hypothetical protein
MQIFGCMRLTEMIGLKKYSEEPVEFKSVLSETTSDFGAFQQPIKFVIVVSTLVGFVGNSANDALFRHSKNSQLAIAFREARDFIHAHAQDWCDYICDVATRAIHRW